MTEQETIQECCADENNLVAQPTGRADLTVKVCEKCGRRHFEVSVDPGDLRAKPV
jgi:hypothetical protein